MIFIYVFISIRVYSYSLLAVMAAASCLSNRVYIRKTGRCKLQKSSAATVRDYVWGCETLQNPTHPPHQLVDSFLPGWALPAIDSTPPPLLCSVIQTWKVNNKLTSSLVCILLWCSQTSYLLRADQLCLRNRYRLKMRRRGKYACFSRLRGAVFGSSS